VAVKIGMLWFDGEGHKEMPVRVQVAASYYRHKYGRVPNVCFVHPSMLTEPSAASVDGVEIRLSPAVLRGHIWMGVDDREP
jgi:hypothetical protein